MPKKEDFTYIELNMNGEKAHYNGELRQVSYYRNGILLSACIPSDYPLSMIINFMESLLKADL